MIGKFGNDANTVLLMNIIGGSLADESGNGNNGTLSGSGSMVKAGFPYDAVNFTSNNTKVTITDASSLDLTGAFTIEFWANITAAANYGAFIAKGATASYQVLQYSTTRRIAFRCAQDSDTLLSTNDANGILKIGVWYYIACVYTGAAVEIYINGARNSVGAFTTNPIANTTNLFFGSRGTSEYYSGYLASVKISNVARTYKQIKGYYNSIKQGA